MNEKSDRFLLLAMHILTDMQEEDELYISIKKHNTKENIGEMEEAISAVVGALVSQFISYVSNKYTNLAHVDDKLERLQQLLLRIHAVVEEADGRHITSPMMLKQLKFLAESMYQGYSTLDKFKYHWFFQHEIREEEVRNRASILSAISSPMKRLRTLSGTSRYIVLCDDLQNTIDSLEAALVNLSEFVVLLGGCERILRRPFDTYLYTDNFMFGRHSEKQHITNILLQNPEHLNNLSGPMVLPIIGGFKVGKKTLVAHVCNDERVRSLFPSILHIDEDSMWSIDRSEIISNSNTLVIVELFSDIDDEDWVKFYSSVASKAGSRSKVIVITRLHCLARLGTVKPVYVNRLSRDEFSYLFKMLAFGSTDAAEHPQLAAVASKLATTVLCGSLVTGNVAAELLRRKLDIQFWLHISQRFKAMSDNNLSKFGENPRDLIEKEHPVEINGFASSSSPVRLRLMMPALVEKDDSRNKRKKISQVMFGDIIAGCTPIPKDEFEIVSWESRLPPYTKFVNSVEVCVDKKDSHTTSQGKRPFTTL